MLPTPNEDAPAPVPAEAAPAPASTPSGAAPVATPAPASDAAAPDAPDAPDAAADAPADAAPYDGLIAPEGTTLDPADMALATPLMRGLGIADGEAAQSFINGVTPILAQITTRLEARFGEDMTTRQAEQTRVWGEELRSDPEIGGARYDATMAAAARARDAFFDADTKAFFEASGFGNFPGLVRGLAKAAAAIQDDSVHGLNHQPALGKPGDSLYDPAYSPKT